MKPSASPTSPLRIGILGCANITRAWAGDVAASPALLVVAVGSRSQDIAATLAALARSACKGPALHLPPADA